MIAKVEFIGVLMLGIFAYVTGKDLAIIASISASVLVGLANLPKAIETVKTIIKKLKFK